MRLTLHFLLAVATVSIGIPTRCLAQAFAVETSTTRTNAVLWTNPDDIKARSLYYGPGGEDGQPKGPFTFVKEDLGGTNPKFDVRDSTGTKWKVKLGLEARPETVATRLLWAVGFVTNENYFLSEIKVDDMPRLKRGKKMVGPGGEIHAVRLQKPPEGKKIGTWKWRDNPFKGTREFNGLRVMMALLSNWDLKDDNNAIYSSKDQADPALYEVSDVGSTFGMSGESYAGRFDKNNFSKYQHSKFISKVTPQYVSFNFPTHLPYIYAFNVPLFYSVMRQRWIGQKIPRADAKWMAGLLSQLSPDQIRDAFRAGGYSTAQVEAYTMAVQRRIEQLQRL